MSCKVCKCVECTSGMLICDHCGDAFHCSCCNPHVTILPVGVWLCSSCKIKRCELLNQKSMGNLISEYQLGSLEFMFRDKEPYMSSVRIGSDFQADVREWCSPINERPKHLHIMAQDGASNAEIQGAHAVKRPTQLVNMNKDIIKDNDIMVCKVPQKKLAQLDMRARREVVIDTYPVMPVDKAAQDPLHRHVARRIDHREEDNARRWAEKDCQWEQNEKRRMQFKKEGEELSMNIDTFLGIVEASYSRQMGDHETANRLHTFYFGRLEQWIRKEAKLCENDQLAKLKAAKFNDGGSDDPGKKRKRQCEDELWAPEEEITTKSKGKGKGKATEMRVREATILDVVAPRSPEEEAAQIRLAQDISCREKRGEGTSNPRGDYNEEWEKRKKAKAVKEVRKHQPSRGRKKEIHGQGE